MLPTLNIPGPATGIPILLISPIVFISLSDIFWHPLKPLLLYTEKEFCGTCFLLKFTKSESTVLHNFFTDFILHLEALPLSFTPVLPS